MWERNIERLTAMAATHDVERKLLSVPWLRGGDAGGAVLAQRFGYERRPRLPPHDQAQPR